MLPEHRQACSLRVALILATALATYGCTPQVKMELASATQDWAEEGLAGQRITTAHFEIISTVRDAELEAGLPGFMEAAYRRYQDTLPSPEDRPSKLTVYVFGTRPEWEQFTRRRFPARYPVYSRIRAGGFTEDDVSVLFYVNRAATLATLAHEGWHQYLAAGFGTPIPAWLNEGLACYHEAVDCAGAEPRFTPRHNTFRINSLREALQTDTLLSLPEIVTTDAGQILSRDRSRITQIYYAQAWALITFLRHGAGGRHAADFERLLADLADDTFRVRVSAARLGATDPSGVSLGEAAFRAYFGRGPEALADEYYDHLVRVAGF